MSPDDILKENIVWALYNWCLGLASYFARICQKISLLSNCFQPICFIWQDKSDAFQINIVWFVQIWQHKSFENLTTISSCWSRLMIELKPVSSHCTWNRCWKHNSKPLPPSPPPITGPRWRFFRPPDISASSSVYLVHVSASETRSIRSPCRGLSHSPRDVRRGLAAVLLLPARLAQLRQWLCASSWATENSHWHTDPNRRKINKKEIRKGEGEKSGIEPAKYTAFSQRPCCNQPVECIDYRCADERKHVELRGEFCAIR
jgi:hypothetical protein